MYTTQMCAMDLKEFKNTKSNMRSTKGQQLMNQRNSLAVRILWKSTRLRWAEYVIRKNDDRAGKIILFKKGAQVQGRSPKKCLDYVEGDLEKRKLELEIPNRASNGNDTISSRMRASSETA